MADYFIEKNGDRDGPYTLAGLKKMIGSGDLASGSLVWAEGMSDWVDIATLPELSGTLAAAEQARKKAEAEERAERAQREAAAAKAEQAERAQREAAEAKAERAERALNRSVGRRKALGIIVSLIGLAVGLLIWNGSDLVDFLPFDGEMFAAILFIGGALIVATGAAKKRKG